MYAPNSDVVHIGVQEVHGQFFTHRGRVAMTNNIEIAIKLLEGQTVVPVRIVFDHGPQSHYYLATWLEDGISYSEINLPVVISAKDQDAAINSFIAAMQQVGRTIAKQGGELIEYDTFNTGRFLSMIEIEIVNQ